MRRLAHERCALLTADRSEDLRRQDDVERWFNAQRPDLVFMVAAMVVWHLRQRLQVGRIHRRIHL